MWFNSRADHEVDRRAGDAPDLRAPGRVRQLTPSSPPAVVTELHGMIATESELLASIGIARVRRRTDAKVAAAGTLAARAQHLNQVVARREAEAIASGDGSLVLGLLMAAGALTTVAAEFYFTRTTLAALLELEGLAADMLAAGATAAMMALELPLLRLLAAQVRRHELRPRARFALYAVVWTAYLACAATAGELILHTAPARAEAVKLLGDLVGSGGEVTSLDDAVVARFLGWLTVFVAGAAALLGATAHVELASACAGACARSQGRFARWRLAAVQARHRVCDSEAKRYGRDLPRREQEARLAAQSWACDLRTEILQRLERTPPAPLSIEERVDQLLLEQLENSRSLAGPRRSRGAA